MPTTIAPERLFFGAPASLTVGGEEAGTTFEAPKVTIEYTTNADKATPQGARGKIKGLHFTTTATAKGSTTIAQPDARSAITSKAPRIAMPSPSSARCQALGCTCLSRNKAG